MLIQNIIQSVAITIELISETTLISSNELKKLKTKKNLVYLFNLFIQNADKMSCIVLSIYLMMKDLYMCINSKCSFS